VFFHPLFKSFRNQIVRIGPDPLSGELSAREPDLASLLSGRAHWPTEVNSAAFSVVCPPLEWVAGRGPESLLAAEEEAPAVGASC
jgi:hypothetical protein